MTCRHEGLSLVTRTANRKKLNSCSLLQPSPFSNPTRTRQHLFTRQFFGRGGRLVLGLKPQLHRATVHIPYKDLPKHRKVRRGKGLGRHTEASADAADGSPSSSGPTPGRRSSRWQAPRRQTWPPPSECPPCAPACAGWAPPPISGREAARGEGGTISENRRALT